MNEKTLMLTFARELRDTLRRTGAFEVILTRDEDVFVSLERRVSIAHEAGADIFLSLHADALGQGHATGATVYTLAKEASDRASEILAERHDRADILAGIDLSQADDEVADVLLDLARLETQPRTALFAETLVARIGETTGLLNKKPLRHAGFSVLKAADVPSVLLEVGFLSSAKDRERLADPNWRALMAGAIRDALQAWVEEDRVLRGLLRQ
jgi:N-acetylmuramoyl-L-alanine amidase